MSRLLPIALLLVAVALAAAGCGAGSADKQANEAYAEGVCTAIGNWTNQVKSLATVPSGGITKASIDAKLNGFETATEQLVSQIKAVPAPKTSEGKSAKQQIDQLATQVRAASAAVQSAASKLPADASITQLVAALSTLLPQFQTLNTTAQSTLDAVKNAGGSLADAFQSTRACKRLG